jgi:hypothetical protein
VLDNVNGPSSLAASLSTVVELFEGQIDTTIYVYIYIYIYIYKDIGKLVPLHP